MHNWTIVGRGDSVYIYKCKKCGCVTPSGTPLKSPYDKVCK